MNIFELSITPSEKLLLLLTKEYSTKAFKIQELAKYINTTTSALYQSFAKLEKMNIINLAWDSKILFIKFQEYEITVLNPVQFKTKLTRKAKTNADYYYTKSELTGNSFIGFNKKVYEFSKLYSQIVGDKLYLPLNKKSPDWDLLKNIVTFIESNNLNPEIFLKAQLQITTNLQKNSSLKITKYLVLSTKNALSHYSNYVHSLNDKKLDVTATQKDSIKESLLYSKALVDSTKANFPNLSDEEVLLFILDSLSPVYLAINPIYLRLINTTLKADDRVVQVLHKLKNTDYKNLVLSLYKEVMNEKNY